MALVLILLARRFSEEVVDLRRDGKDLVGDFPRGGVFLISPVCALLSLCRKSRRVDQQVMLGKACDNDESDEAD